MVHRFGLNYTKLRNLIIQHQNVNGFLKQMLSGCNKVENPPFFASLESVGRVRETLPSK